MANSAVFRVTTLMHEISDDFAAQIISYILENIIVWIAVYEEKRYFADKRDFYNMIAQAVQAQTCFWD